MKKILYLLCSCFAVTLMASCEDFLDKTPQGDKTDQDIFSRFNETESLINRLYFYARAADQPLVHIRFFSDSALTDECEGSSAENGWSNKFNDGDWEPGSQLYTSCNATTNSGAYPKTQHRICGMRPVEDPNGKISVGGKTYRMERFWKENRVFLEKHYLFPIPTEELQRANIPQNPNW